MDKQLETTNEHDPDAEELRVKRIPFIPPTIMKLTTAEDIKGGISNVPEAETGFFS